MSALPQQTESSQLHRHSSHQELQPIHLRPYANIAPSSGNSQNHHQTPTPREYANVSLTTATGCASELDDPQLNYMDIDFSTGMGVPALRSTIVLPYALLGGGGVSATAGIRWQEKLRYVELDFRAMTALAATAQSAADAKAASAAAAASAATATAAAASHKESSNNSSSSKSSSFARLRSSVIRSLRRFRLRRQGRGTAATKATEERQMRSSKDR